MALRFLRHRRGRRLDRPFAGEGFSTRPISPSSSMTDGERCATAGPITRRKTLATKFNNLERVIGLLSRDRRDIRESLTSLFCQKYDVDGRIFLLKQSRQTPVPSENMASNSPLNLQRDD